MLSIIKQILYLKNINTKNCLKKNTRKNEKRMKGKPTGHRWHHRPNGPRHFRLSKRECCYPCQDHPRRNERLWIVLGYCSVRLEKWCCQWYLLLLLPQNWLGYFLNRRHVWQYLPVHRELPNKLTMWADLKIGGKKRSRKTYWIIEFLI